MRRNVRKPEYSQNIGRPLNVIGIPYEGNDIKTHGPSFACYKLGSIAVRGNVIDSNKSRTEGVEI